MPNDSPGTPYLGGTAVLLFAYSGGEQAIEGESERQRRLRLERGRILESLNPRILEPWPVRPLARLQLHTGLHSRAEAGQRQAPPAP
jgi:hypothetical protein